MSAMQVCAYQRCKSVHIVRVSAAKSGFLATIYHNMKILKDIRAYFWPILEPLLAYIPNAKSIFFFPIFGGKFPISNQKKNLKRNHHFIMVKVGLKLSNIQHCTVSYKTCNGDYKLTLQLNSDKYMMYFMI